MLDSADDRFLGGREPCDREGFCRSRDVLNRRVDQTSPASHDA
jgi:hypothetical protein